MSKPKKNENDANNPSKTSQISEIAKKILLTGVGAVFMTEESIRNTLTDLKLPKDVIQYLGDQAKKQKDDLVHVVASEVSKFLSKIKVQDEIRKALAAIEIQVDAKLRFKLKENSDKSLFELNIKSD